MVLLIRNPWPFVLNLKPSLQFADTLHSFKAVKCPSIKTYTNLLERWVLSPSDWMIDPLLFRKKWFRYRYFFLPPPHFGFSLRIGCKKWKLTARRKNRKLGLNMSCKFQNFQLDIPTQKSWVPPLGVVVICFSHSRGHHKTMLNWPWILQILCCL